MSGTLPYQIKTSRDNLLYVGRMSIKSVIDRSCFETLHDRAPEVINFCNILEHILSFCTKAVAGGIHALYSVDNKRHPWLFIRETCRMLPDSCVPTIDTMENLKGYYAKLRGWIKMALLQKRLAEYLQHAMQQMPTVMKYYDPRALMRSPDLNVYLNTLMGLTAVDFSFDLRGEDQVHPGLVCIDYTPYLRFTPSDEGILDDALECHEHLDLNSTCPWQERFLKLEVKYKTEAQQKHFLEERLRSVDAQMMNREVEREQFETEMRQLESVVLELQVQITLLHEQYRDELLRAGGNPDALPNLPAARGHTRTLPPSQLVHRLAPVEPTRRPHVGHQQFASGRRYSSPRVQSREDLLQGRLPLGTTVPPPALSASSSRSNTAYEATSNGDLWADEELERVILFPEDEQESTPEREGDTNGSSSDAPVNSLSTPGANPDDLSYSSVPPTPDIVRRLRHGDEKSAAGYYRLMATPGDDSAAVSLAEEHEVRQVAPAAGGAAQEALTESEELQKDEAKSEEGKENGVGEEEAESSAQSAVATVSPPSTTSLDVPAS